ncbi:hypothetical protein D3C71_1438590 [compost metagenome]
MEQHDVVFARETRVDRFQRALGHLRHGDGLEDRLQVGEDLARRGGLGRQGSRAAGKFLAATACGNQSDASFDQADIAFQCQHAVRSVHQEFAAAAQRHALHGGHGGNARVLERLGRALEFFDHGFQHVELALGARLHHLLQVGPHGKGRFVPDDQAVEITLGTRHGLQHAFQYFAAQRVVLRRDGQDGDARIHVRQVPQAHAFVFPHGDATVIRAFAEDTLGEQLAAIHRQ